jgi:hypothetical protein
MEDSRWTTQTKEKDSWRRYFTILAPSSRVLLHDYHRPYAMITRAPSRPSTPRSCGLGLEDRPFRLMNPSIPTGLFLGGTVADLSAKFDHDPASSNTICTPPLGDSFLTPLPPLPILVIALAGSSDGGFNGSKLSGGEPDPGEPTIDFAEWALTLIAIAFDGSTSICNSCGSRGGLIDGLAQSGCASKDGGAVSTGLLCLRRESANGP